MAAPFVVKKKPSNSISVTALSARPQDDRCAPLYHSGIPKRTSPMPVIKHRRNMTPVVAVALLCMMLLVPSITADDWTYGRATWYDDNSQGSCHYYTNIPEWYAAWPDTQYGFSTSCGTCWEVSCVDTDFHDGYGEWMHRSNACKDTGLSVKVKIVDSCPCIHQNFYSNQRWCCGDMKHIDLGRKVFEQLADLNIGVIGLKWRQVSCDYLGLARTDGQAPSSQPGNSGATSGDGTPVTRTQHTFGELFAAAWMGQTLDGQSDQQSQSSPQPSDTGSQSNQNYQTSQQDDKSSNSEPNSNGNQDSSHSHQAANTGSSGGQKWQSAPLVTQSTSQGWKPFWVS